MSSLTWAVVLLAGLTCAQALGTPESIENYPQLGQTHYRIGTGWSQQGVVAIISNYYVIAAASCFQDLVINRRISVGSATRHQGDLREVSYVLNHPSYGNNGDDGDISIVRVIGSFIFGPRVAPGPIVPQNYYIPQNQAVTLLAWGSTTEGGNIGNDLLYSLEMETKYINDCRSKWSNYDNPRVVTENMLCLGLSYTEGRDKDPRDNGAPVFYYNALAGLTSFGTSRGRDEVPIMATAISPYSNWIVENAS